MDSIAWDVFTKTLNGIGMIVAERPFQKAKRRYVKWLK